MSRNENWLIAILVLILGIAGLSMGLEDGRRVDRTARWAAWDVEWADELAAERVELDKEIESVNSELVLRFDYLTQTVLDHLKRKGQALQSIEKEVRERAERLRS